MKEYKLPLLSFTIPLNQNPFDLLSQNYRISYCELPEYIKSHTEHWKIFPKLHNWAKNEITETYHVDRGNRRIYILTPNTRLLKKEPPILRKVPLHHKACLTT